MKKMLIMALACACATASAQLVSGTAMGESEKIIYAQKLLPQPKFCEFKAGDFFIIEDGCQISVQIAYSLSDEEKGIAKKLTAQYWDVPVKISFSENSDAAKITKDGYNLDVSKNSISISTSDFGGLLNSLKTLRQLSESRRGSTKFNSYVLPQCIISDEPTLEFRGIHLCVFPDTTVSMLEKYIRIAAYYKMNYAVIEFWGTTPFKKYTEFSWPEIPVSRSEMKRLVALSKELGIVLVPQVNVLGHSSGSVEPMAKHCVLSLNKSMQNHFEPEGWSWCISNPETIKILFEMMEDIHELFGNPPYFHAGFDEAYEVGTCSLCRKTPRKNLIRDHLLSIRNFMKNRGARTMIWHDMFAKKGDDRWPKDYVANGTDETCSILNEIPKDIIICDWQYYIPDNKEHKKWPTFTYFTDMGFDILPSTWMNRNNMASMGKIARNKKFLGMLSTTWNNLDGKLSFNALTYMAEEMWGKYNDALPSRRKAFRMDFNHNISQIDWDMKCSKRSEAGAESWWLWQ